MYTFLTTTRKSRTHAICPTRYHEPVVCHKHKSTPRFSRSTLLRVTRFAGGVGLFANTTETTRTHTHSRHAHRIYYVRVCVCMRMYQSPSCLLCKQMGLLCNYVSLFQTGANAFIYMFATSFCCLCSVNSIDGRISYDRIEFKSRYSVGVHANATTI